MTERRVIPEGSAATLTVDRDYTYFTHADSETDVFDLAAKITDKGLRAALARPMRIRKMTQLVGIEYNFPEPDPMFIDCPREMTTAELAHNLTRLNILETKGYIE